MTLAADTWLFWCALTNATQMMIAILTANAIVSARHLRPELWLLRTFRLFGLHLHALHCALYAHWSLGVRPTSQSIACHTQMLKP